METVAQVLLYLSHKPREAGSVPPSLLPVIKELERRDCVARHKLSGLPEQDMLWVTHNGLRWLSQHGLFKKEL
jgi:hypothetical protein